MQCPECGAPIEKGFYTCTNCKLKIKLTIEATKGAPVEEVSREEEKGISIKSVFPEEPDKEEQVKEDAKVLKPRKVKKDTEIRIGAKDNKVKTSKKDVKVLKPKKVKKATKIGAKGKIDDKIVAQKDIKKTSAGITKDTVPEKERTGGAPVEEVGREEEKGIRIKSVFPEEPDKEEKVDIKTKEIEESRPSPVQKDKKIKRSLTEKIRILYERLIDDSFQGKT
ncbi:MAG: hypothetical protein K8S14_08760 [Actinomycetia bacterium]|nr:hypothetical protein [Actinomycetes bacterium]